MSALKTRVMSAHLGLIISCAFYMVIGAWVFQLLEGPRYEDTKSRQLEQIHEDSERYLEQVWEMVQNNREALTNEKAKKDLVKRIQAENKQRFDKVIDLCDLICGFSMWIRYSRRIVRFATASRTTRPVGIS